MGDMWLEYILRVVAEFFKGFPPEMRKLIIFVTILVFILAVFSICIFIVVFRIPFGG